MRHKSMILLFIVGLFFGCEGYLDVVPENDMTTISSIFTKRNTAMQFFNGCYQAYLGEGAVTVDPAVTGGDEFVTGEYMRGKKGMDGFKIASGLQSVMRPYLAKWDSYSNLYIAIGTCNTFIEHVDEVYNMTDGEKEQYKAEAKAMKALYYFDLMKMYGAIPIVPKNIPIESTIEEMQIPRKPVDEVVDTIVSLFDQAIPYLVSFSHQSNRRFGTLNKEAVYTYKAKVLVYAASPLFNGNDWYANFKNRNGEQLFNIDYDVTKWERAAKACDEALEYCEGHGRFLNKSSHGETSELLNTIRNIQNSVLPENWMSSELIHGIVKAEPGFLYKLPRYSEKESEFTVSVDGCLNPSLRMVELFYTENGLPIDQDRTWNYLGRFTNNIEKSTKYQGVIKLNEPMLNLHLKREPRFYADIAFDKGYWKRNNSDVLMNPYKGGTHGYDYESIDPESRYNITGYWCKKMIPAKIYANKISVNVTPICPYPKLRLADLYLLQAEAWNEVGGKLEEKVYPAINKVRERAGIPTVQKSWKDYSKQPQKITTREGMRDIIHQERMIEMAFESQRFWDLRRWKKADKFMNIPIKGWNILGENSEDFYNHYRGPIVVWRKNRFQTPRDYFWPIRDEEIIRSSVSQNPGW